MHKICLILLYTSYDSWLASPVILSCAERSKRGIIDGNLHPWPSIWTIRTDEDMHCNMHSRNLLIFSLSDVKRNENVWYRAVVGVNLLLQMCPPVPTTQRSTQPIPDNVIFSPQTLFLAPFFSTQKRVNREKICLRQNSENSKKYGIAHSTKNIVCTESHNFQISPHLSCILHICRNLPCS